MVKNISLKVEVGIEVVSKNEIRESDLVINHDELGVTLEEDKVIVVKISIPNTPQKEND